MHLPGEGAWPLVYGADLPFIVAAHEASRRLGLPFEVAKEALRHAIRNREVIVCTPVTADGETTYVHIQEYSIDVKDEPDAVIDAATSGMWLIDRRHVDYGHVITEIAVGDEAKATTIDKPIDAQVAPIVKEVRINERNAGRKLHKTIGPVMAMAGAWLEEQDYSAGDEITEAVLKELRKAMEEFAQHLEDEDALDETLSEAEKKKAPCPETIRKWSHVAMEAHRAWRGSGKPQRN